LRQRLELEGRIFPIELVPWNKYDGSCPCFEPDNMSAEELQKVGFEIMSGFYNLSSFIKIALRTISFPIDYFIRGRRYWYREVIKCGGYFLIRRRRKEK